jgi:hypothetical protein
VGRPQCRISDSTYTLKLAVFHILFSSLCVLLFTPLAGRMVGRLTGVMKGETPWRCMISRAT